MFGPRIEPRDLTEISLCNQGSKKHLFSASEKKNFREEINRLLKIVVIRPVAMDTKCYISFIFLRKKINISHRLILDLKNFNNSVVYRHFKMKTLTVALVMGKKDSFIINIDLTDACHSVRIALENQKYLLFRFSGQLYQYVCLTNGLSFAPRIFTKILKPVFSALHKQSHQIIRYLDETFLVGDTLAQRQEAVISTV